MDKTKKRRIQILVASVLWLGVWQAAAAAIGQEVFLVSPVQAIGTLVELLPQAEFWQRIGFSAGRILLGFGLGVLSSAVLAVAPKSGSGWTPSRPRDAAGQGYSGGELHHSGAGVGQRLVAVRPDQLSDGAARPLQRSAHRHRECRTASFSKWRRCSVCLWGGVCGRSGSRRCCPRSGRGAAWRWASAGRAA